MSTSCSGELKRITLHKCRDKKVHQLQDIDEDDYNFDALFVGSIHCSKRKKKSKTTDSFTKKLSILNTEIQFQLDTSAKCYILSISDFKKLKLSTACIIESSYCMEVIFRT